MTDIKYITIHTLTLLSGKTMENVRKRINFHICTNGKQLRKKTSSPYFVSATIFRENMVGVEMLKKDVRKQTVL